MRNHQKRLLFSKKEKKKKGTHVHPPTNDKNSFDLFSFASTTMNGNNLSLSAFFILKQNREKLDNDVIYIVTNTKVFFSRSHKPRVVNFDQLRKYVD